MTNADVVSLQQYLRAIHDPTETLSAKSRAFEQARPFIDALTQRVAGCVMGEVVMTEQELSVADALLRHFPDFVASSLGMHEDQEVRRFMCADQYTQWSTALDVLEERCRVMH